jgi:hypothetical protein
MKCAIPLAVMMTFLTATSVLAQLPSGWRAHDLDRPAPLVVDPGNNNLPTGVPSDATVLFDGSNLDQWTSAGGDAKWKVVDGAMESVPNSGYLFTKQKFGDCQLHIEWASPQTPKGKGQGRGNSGVYLMGKYEIQVLDSFDNPTYADGSAGSIYGQYPPLVNASRKPGEWQSYDIIFRRPRFDDSGALKSPARITVLHNGVLIQDNEEAFGPTNWIQHNDYQPHPDQLPLSLQDHGNPVRFRNIWIRPLDAERTRPDKPYETEAEIIELAEERKTKMVGKYGPFRVENRNGTMYFMHHGMPLEMIPLAESKFAFRKSAGHAEFVFDDNGQVASVTLSLDAAGSRSIPKSAE